MYRKTGELNYFIWGMILTVRECVAKNLRIIAPVDRKNLNTVNQQKIDVCQYQSCLMVGSSVNGAPQEVSSAMKNRQRSRTGMVLLLTSPPPDYIESPAGQNFEGKEKLLYIAIGLCCCPRTFLRMCSSVMVYNPEPSV